MAIARDGLRRWPDGDRSWKFRLSAAESLFYLGRPRESASMLNSSALPSALNLRARLKMDRARLAQIAGLATAAPLMRESLQDALASDDSALVCMVRLRLGELSAGSSESESYIRTALADAIREGDPFLLSWARVDLGYTLAKAARFDQAVPILQSAIETARECGAKSMLAAALGNLGWCFRMLGEFDRSEGCFIKAEALSGQIGAIDSQQRWLGSLGVIYMNRGDLSRATGYQQRAAALARDAGNEAWLAIAYHNLAEIAVEKGDLAEARSFSDRALEMKRRLKDDWSLAYGETLAAEIDLLAKRYGDAREGYEKVIERAPRAHAPSLLWHAYGRLAFLYQKTGKPALAEACYRKAIATIDREWNKLGSDEWKTTFLAPMNLIGFFQDYVDFLIDKGEPLKALEVAESSRARVLNQRLEHRADQAPHFRIASLLAATRESNIVILDYWLARRSSVWVIAAGRVSRFDLPPVAEIARLVQKHSAAITDGGDPLWLDDALSSALNHAVLGPVHHLIPTGSNVIVLPDDALHELAFETLVVPGPPPHYWIEDVSVAIAPSLRVLQDGALLAPSAPKLLLMGDPVIAGQEFPPLPHIRDEIAAVADCFSNRTVLTGSRAVPSAYAQAFPANFTHIHFATHSTSNRESPLNSAIILSPERENYKLYARDVAEVPLRATLVTLSACRSAGGQAFSGEGLLGFAWAFLQAGAENVIATLWDESEAVSTDLMRVLYREIASGQPPALALRSAKLAVLRSNPRYHTPYYWGSMQLFTRRIPASARPNLPFVSEKLS